VNPVPALTYMPHTPARRAPDQPERYQLIPTNPTQTAICALLMAVGLTASAEEQVIIQGIDVDVRQTIDSGPQGGQADGAIGQDVQDLGDGSTNDGGAPDAEVDLHDAAIRGEQNLGPNAPGYIP
jgi:hypothetical protein